MAEKAAAATSASAQTAMAEDSVDQSSSTGSHNAAAGEQEQEEEIVELSTRMANTDVAPAVLDAHDLVGWTWTVVSPLSHLSCFVLSSSSVGACTRFAHSAGTQ